MSITDDIKEYADAAVETGRSAVNDGIEQGRAAVNERITTLRTSLDEGIDEAGDRAAKLAENASGFGTSALDRARYDAYAAVGAADAVVTGVVARLQEFPNEVVGTVAKAQNVASDAADRVTARVNGLVERAANAAGNATRTVDDVRTGALFSELRDKAQARREEASEQFAERRAELHARGEAVVTELRRDPRVSRLVELVGAAVVEVEDAAAKPSRRRAAEQAQETRARNERSARAKKAASTRARKSAPAKKAAPRKRAAAKKSTSTGSTTA